MKKQILFILLIFLYVFNLNIYSQQQVPPDWIRQYEGIPIVASMHWHWLRDNPDAVKDMKKAGVDVLRFHIENENHITTLSDTSQEYGFQFIPGNTLGSNSIHYYTDAKYSVWEAEGNPDFDANLIFFDDTKMNDSVMVVRGNGNNKYLKLLPNAASLQDTALIWGPYYRQDVNYFTTLDGIYRKVDYRADYRMKLEWEPTADTTQYYNPSTEICRVQITYSYALFPDSLSCTYAIVDSVLTLDKFLPLDNWTDFIFEYDLVDDPCANSSVEISPQSYTDYMSDFRRSSEQIPKREDRKYIQFKVIWFGNPDFLLSIDKVTISDDRGRDLVFQTFPTNQIQAQDQLLENHYDFITGYIGFDEPTSLDIAEPIRIVKEILDTKSNMKRPLWLPWMQFWDAAFESRNNTFGAMSLNPWLEFKKRVGKGNIIQNVYMFDSPEELTIQQKYIK